ncbi:MAG: prephenate dehydrogenase/arogenate dehydrogenase family protein [Chloroflexota bacterium]
MHVAFIGFGLIGGSIARAIRASTTTPAWTMAAWSPSGEGPAQALADDVIDRAAAMPTDAFSDADLVVLAVPPTACLAALDELAGSWRAALPTGAIITDVASTKEAIIRRADAVGLRFVGGHPMAGLESTGYAASRADLFVDRPWVVIPGRVATNDDVERVEFLVEACLGRVVRVDAADHDRAVAGISHLPLILAAALVESVAGGGAGSARPDWPTAARLSAGGWRDMTRLARGDPAMGAGIAVTNAAAIADRLRDLTAVLEGWRRELEQTGGPDESTLEERLRAARTRLEDPELP